MKLPIDYVTSDLTNGPKVNDTDPSARIHNHGLTLARTWGGWMPPPPGRFCALYPLFLKLEI